MIVLDPRLILVLVLVVVYFAAWVVLEVVDKW